jgi:protein-S-isoprenylcysteine O-methyltransferase Ste14
MLVRHLVSIAVLPFTVAVLIPVWLARRNGTSLSIAGDPGGIAAQLVGVIVLIVGVVLFAASLQRFWSEGKGTLAPWDPPRELVVNGPYRYVRNPMISGVIFVLFGEALILRSRPQLSWALIFLAANFVYIPLLEEPMLRARFGESYARYCRNVRRFIPRLTPWSGNSTERNSGERSQEPKT